VREEAGIVPNNLVVVGRIEAGLMEQRLGFEIGYFENRRVKEEGDFTSDGV
jgi:hypothetical protein